MLPVFLFPFDAHIALVIVGGLWLSRHFHWPRNATVRRLDRLAARDRARLLIVLLALSAVRLHAQSPLAGVRAIHLKDYATQIGDTRAVATCLMRKLSDRGPFTFPDTPDTADAVLALTATVPTAGKRAWGAQPFVVGTLTTRDGAVLWEGKNNLKKATTAWGAKDMECGLADGLARKITQAIEKAGRTQ
jgi:hypothetical protein